MNRTTQRELKGIAIICMTMLHFWGHPNWYEIYMPSYSFQSALPNGVYYFLGSFGNVCVSIFAFLTGFGFFICREKYEQTQYRLVKGLSFLCLYWIYEIIFLVVGFFIGSKLPSPATLLWNLIGVNAEIGSEHVCIPFAWYTWLYLLILILYPIINKIGELNIPVSTVICLVPYLITHLIRIVTDGGDLWITASRMCAIICVIIGYMFAKHGFFESSSVIYRKKFTLIFYVLIILIIRWLNWDIFNGLYGIMYAIGIMWIYCLVIHMYNRTDGLIRKILQKLGDNCTGMWFIAGLFFIPPGSLCKYGYISRNPWIVLIWVIGISFLASYLVNIFVYKRVDGFLRKKV